MPHWLVSHVSRVLRRYQAVLIGSTLVLCATVTPASWEAPMPPPLPRPTVQLPPTHPWVAFTFDDGPHPQWTEKLLKVLREQDIPATFFVVGKMAERRPDLLQAIADEGHEIENHTYSHPSMSRLDSEQVLRELDRTRTLIRNITGRESILYRPPGGDYTRQTVRIASKAGYKMVLWSVMTNDVEGASKFQMRRRILKNIDDGAIVLMHSGVQGTLDLLPEIAAELRRKGYHFVTVATMLGMSSQDVNYAPDAVQTAQATSPSNATSTK